MAYTMTTMRRALELREAGWTPTQVRKQLEREGLGAPSTTTLRKWACPEYDRRQRALIHEYGSRRAADSATFRLRGSTGAYKHAFMTRLRSEGLSAHAIGVVHGIVFDERLTEQQVRYALRDIPKGRAA